MNHQDYIYNELKEITPFLAELEKRVVFNVPENYFSTLPTIILDKVVDDILFPAHKLPFTLPGSYFENLSEDILQKIKNQDFEDYNKELKEISPILYEARKENVFTVPPDYFSTLPTIFLNEVKPTAKVVVMKKRSMVWSVAAAAIITGVMAVGALFTGNTSFNQDTFMADNNADPVDIRNALQYKNEEQINKGIADLSDADIVKYLENTGSNADDEALASGIPEKELPDEQDYLNDDNTLQTFLDKTDANNQN